MAVAARPTDNTDILFAYSQKNTSEYEPGENGEAIKNPTGFEVTSEYVSGTSMDTESSLFKAGWDITDNQRLQFTYLDFKAGYSETSMQNSTPAYTLDQCSHPGNENESYCQNLDEDYDLYPIASTSDITNTNMALDYSFSSDHPWLNVKAKIYTVDTENVSESASQNVWTKTQTQTLGYSLTNTAYQDLFSVGELELTGGYEFYHDETKPDEKSTDTNGNIVVSENGITPKGNKEISSLFFNSRWLFLNDRLQLHSGIRKDTYHLWGTTTYRLQGDPWVRDVDHEESKILNSYGLSIKPLDSLEIFFNAGEGWRPPAITETLISGSPAGHPTPVPTMPNWTLEPEETTSQEIGLNLKFDRIFSNKDRFSLKLTHFENTTENYIFLMNYVAFPGDSYPSMSQSMYANGVEDIKYTGYELTLNYDDDIWFSELTLTQMERDGRTISWVWPAGGTSGQENYIRENSYTDGMYDPIPPEYTLGFDLGFRLLNKQLVVGSTVTHASETGSPRGSEIGDDSGQQYINDFTVIDLWGSYNIHRNVNLGFNLKNITDQQYIQPQGDAYVLTYAPGRTFTASLEWNF